MSQLLDKLAKELRSAVIAGDHVRANRTVPKYAEALRQFWETLPASDRAVSTLPRLSQELLSWARGMTLVQRTMAAEHLVLVQKIGRYQQARLSRTRPASIQLRG
jgi:hypothetical protein